MLIWCCEQEPLLHGWRVARILDSFASEWIEFLLGKILVKIADLGVAFLKFGVPFLFFQLICLTGLSFYLIVGLKLPWLVCVLFEKIRCVKIIEIWLRLHPIPHLGLITRIRSLSFLYVRHLIKICIFTRVPWVDGDFATGLKPFFSLIFLNLGRNPDWNLYWRLEQTV